MENFVIWFIFVVALIFNIIFLIGIAIKEKNIEYQKKIIKYNKDIYVREIPNTENTAVGVASLVYNLRSLTYMDIGNTIFRIIQATILELNIKGFIEIYEDVNKRTILKIIKKNKEELTSTQYVIYNFIGRFIDENQEIEMKELKKQIIINKEMYRKTFGRHFVNLAIEEQKDLGNMEKDESRYSKIVKYSFLHIINTALIAFVAMLCLAGGIYGSSKVGLIIGIIMSIALVYAIFILIRLTIKILHGRKILNYTEKFDFSKPGTNFVKRFLIESITGKKQIEYSTECIMAFMTKKGLLEKEEWKAFKRFLKDYTLIKEYKRESIVINKEYLVYATLFGIADKVQDDLGKFKPIIIWNY